MNLYVEFDAATLARLTAAPRPACDSIIVRHGDIADVLASSQRQNPLSGQWLMDADAPGSRVLTWSGTLADRLFDGDPRNWMRPGRNALNTFCNDVGPQLAAHGRTLCLLPHCMHVLSDVPSCLGFLRERHGGGGQPFEIALSPATMLAPAMLDRIEEHLQRQFEGLGDRCSMVILTDVQPNAGESGEMEATCVELGAGVLPRSLILTLLNQCVPIDTPIVIDGRGGGSAIARQIEWLKG